MYSVNSYQDIKGPDELEEERCFEGIFQSLLEEFDPECGDFNTYRNWCRKEARERAREVIEKEQENG